MASTIGGRKLKEEKISALLTTGAFERFRPIGGRRTPGISATLCGKNVRKHRKGPFKKGRS